MIERISKIIKLSCIQAGRLVLKIYHLSKKTNGNQNLKISTKIDGSPFTEADKLANDLIVKNLKNFFPNLPIVSEESSQRSNKNFKNFFLVDPLDGTKEFLNFNGEFTVNIGYVCNNKPMLGAVCHPITNRIFWTENKNAWSENYHFDTKKNLAFSNKIKLICKKKKRGNSVVISRTHLDNFTKAFLHKKKFTKIKKLGSSLKIIEICENKADFYPRFGRTMEWDICAAHAILNLSGGILLNTQRKKMVYGKKKYQNEEFFALGNIQDIDYYFN
jgi:3'(2'), 5'-bisphosphate nucleotidase